MIERTPGLIGYEKLQKSAVAILLLENEQQKDWDILFEVRASGLLRQPGEICFPGGRIEKGETPASAAVREAVEELCVKADQIELIGPADIFLSPFNQIIYPYIGYLKHYEGSYSEVEVDHTFCVPLSFFLSRRPQSYETKVSTSPGKDFPFDKIPGGRKYRWREGIYEVDFYQYEAYTIWGLTAKIMSAAAPVIRQYLDERTMKYEKEG